MYKRKKVTLLATNNNILHFIRVACSIYREKKKTCFYLNLSHWGKELNTTYLLANGKCSCSLTELFFTAEHSVKYKRTEIILLGKSYPFYSIWVSQMKCRPFEWKASFRGFMSSGYLEGNVNMKYRNCDWYWLVHCNETNERDWCWKPIKGSVM